MNEAVDLWEIPTAKKVYLIAGWRQWADAGSISSGLPKFLIQETGARQIGTIHQDGFYLFQFPGTHDLVRPTVRFKQGFPEALQTPTNEIYYTEIGQTGLVLFLGDEPHMDVERYVSAFLDAAQALKVGRIITFGGVYGELPYDKERMVSSIFSLGRLREVVEELAVNVSDYQGGASIGSYICRRAGERELEMVGFYAFVPTYDFSSISQLGNSIRIENDFMAWYGVMRRVNFMLKTNIDLSKLKVKSKKLIKVLDSKVEELESLGPQMGVREYINRIAEEFQEVNFNPLDDVWEDELRRLFDKFDDE